MTLFWPDKNPDAIADYVIDWSDDLDTDTISASVWTVPEGLSSSANTYTGTSATIWLSGGTDGQVYKLVNRITTAGLRTFERDVLLRVRSASIVTLADVKRSLRIDHDDDDAMLNMLTRAASNRIVSHMKAQAESFLDDNGNIVPENVPDEVRFATILLVGFYYDPDNDTDFETGQLPKPVTSLLYMLRDPALA